MTYTIWGTNMLKLWKLADVINDKGSKRAIKILTTILPKENKVIALTLLSTAILNSLWIINGLMDWSYSFKSKNGWAVEPNLTHILRQIYIDIGLIISFVVLYFHRMNGLFLSILALIYIQFEYLRWYIYSQKLKEQAGIFQFSEPVIANLYGANSWHICILVLVVTMFVWETKIFIVFLEKQYRNNCTHK